MIMWLRNKQKHKLVTMHSKHNKQKIEKQDEHGMVIAPIADIGLPYDQLIPMIQTTAPFIATSAWTNGVRPARHMVISRVITINGSVQTTGKGPVEIRNDAYIASYRKQFMQVLSFIIRGKWITPKRYSTRAVRGLLHKDIPGLLNDPLFKFIR